MHDLRESILYTSDSHNQSSVEFMELLCDDVLNLIVWDSTAETLESFVELCFLAPIAVHASKQQ